MSPSPDLSPLLETLLSVLGATEIAMTSPEGSALTQAASASDQQLATETLLNVHQARLALANATLSSIADELAANDAALKEGTAAVQAAITSLNDLGQILNSVNSLIGVAAKIAPMV